LPEELNTTQLALHGGAPVRDQLLPYGRHEIDDDDVAAVTRALRSEWLTGGPLVAEFESAIARTVGAADAVAVSSGTAALHAAMFAIDIAPGDEVIVPPITFAATANAVVYQGGTPVFVDVHADTLLIDPAKVAAAITPRTRAVVAVDYAGQTCDYDRLRSAIGSRSIVLVADACHAIGGRDEHGRAAGSIADLSVFSFHPVKHVATGEGGAVATDHRSYAERMRSFRNHGMTVDARRRSAQGSWFYEIVELGYNYRLSDLQCALGVSQIAKLASRVARRQAIAGEYDRAFAAIPEVRPLAVRPGVSHAYHLYVVRIDTTRLACDRATMFAALRREGIGVNVHYIPAHLHPFYRQRFGFGPGLCPVAEAAYESILTLPLFAAMTARDVRDVVDAVTKVVAAFR
jgi:UDP-4-amino-4,6-dideoxy-N-acetyl-beta-L-altrosamine transaminase